MVDTGTGKLAQISPEAAEMLNGKGVKERIFQVGEQLIIKGSRFRITKLTGREMRLKILPKNNLRMV